MRRISILRDIRHDRNGRTIPAALPLEGPDQVIIRRRGSNKGVSHAVLSRIQSRSLRDRLFSELAALGSVEAITVWAHQILSAKSSLTASDAHDVEKAFQAKSAPLNARK